MKVLLVKLPEELSKYIPYVLRVRWPNLSLFHAHEAREAVQLIHSEQPHIAMFHLPERSEGVPPLDYFDLISQIRSFSGVPLIVISQSDDVMDKVKALEMGADAYLTSPLSLRELLARVRSLLRRTRPS